MDGGELILTEGGPKKRPRGVSTGPRSWSLSRAYLGPEAEEITAEQLTEIARRDARRLHPFLRDQRALAGIGRAWSNEILNRAKLSPYALTTELSNEEIERLAATIRSSSARARAPPGRRGGQDCVQGAQPPRRAVPQLRDADRARRLRGAHTIFYCPECQTGGRVLKRPPAVPAAPLALAGHDRLSAATTSVELRARANLQFVERLLGGAGRAVGTVGGHRVVRVAGVDDPRRGGCPLAGEPVRITPSCPSARGTSGRGRPTRPSRPPTRASMRSPRSCASS